MQRLLPLALLLLCGCVTPLGLGGEATSLVLDGADGQAVDPECAPDNLSERSGLAVAGGEPAMLLPNDGCAAGYAVDRLPAGPLDVTLRYRMAGQDGSICGRFLLAGRLEGATPWTCSAPETWLSVQAPAVAGDPNARLLITWETDGLGGHANAFLASARISRAGAATV